jgi:hypothetical protein
MYFTLVASTKRAYEFELYHNPGRGTLNIHINQAGLHIAFRYDGLHLRGDVVEAVAGWGGDVDGLLHFHSCFS